MPGASGAEVAAPAVEAAGAAVVAESPVAVSVAEGLRPALQPEEPKPVPMPEAQSSEAAEHPYLTVFDSSR